MSLRVLLVRLRMLQTQTVETLPADTKRQVPKGSLVHEPLKKQEKYKHTSIHLHIHMDIINKQYFILLII